jgi:hypothetical protein
MRGRKPKSLELKILQGNPGKRPLSSAGPFIEGIPEKPEDRTRMRLKNGIG